MNKIINIFTTLPEYKDYLLESAKAKDRCDLAEKESEDRIKKFAG